MTRSSNRIVRIIANVLLLVPLLCAGIVIYWWAMNTFTRSTFFEEPRVIGPTTLKVGDTLQLSYFIIRYRDCRLEISRMARRPDRREILLQYVVQNIVADHPPHQRISGYSIEIPVGILNPDESRIDVEIFSRVQYFCNGLDLIWPRIVEMKPVPITVTAQ